VALLAQQAPTWLVQMPGLVRAAALETLQRRVAGATRDRMLCELAEALELLTAHRPLLLVLEDLHWSDPSTLDVLAVLARRREPAHLLLLGTYRLPDMLQRGHPLHTVHYELQRHGHCAELPLPLLLEAAVATYLRARFPDARLPAGLARLVHQRSEGNPLFMVTVVEDWMRRGWLVQGDEGWTLRVALATVAGTIPESLWQMLEQQLERLNPLERQVLEVGSVAGATFSAAAVAAGLGHEVVEVEEWCTDLARRRQWLEACGEQVWPDGTVAGGTGSRTRSTRRWHTSGCRPHGGCSSIVALASVRKQAMDSRCGSGPPSWPCTLHAGGTSNAPCGICSMRARTPSSARPTRKPSST